MSKPDALNDKQYQPENYFTVYNLVQGKYNMPITWATQETGDHQGWRDVEPDMANIHSHGRALQG